MKAWFGVSAILLNVVLLFFLHSAKAAEAEEFPTLYFHYSALYDSVCSPELPVKTMWALEAIARENEFAELWNKQGPPLLRQLMIEFQKGFSRKELSVTLSVCHRTPSISDPMILNISRFLKNYMGERPVRPAEEFVDLVFHELLHHWIVENLPVPSPMVQKYRDRGEPEMVLNHLHLMAIQKFIYIKTGRQDLLKAITANYPQMPGIYPHAWTLMEAEGYHSFISELKNLK